MKNKKELLQKINKMTFWLENWFNNKNYEKYGFTETEKIIFSEISDNWNMIDKIKMLNKLENKYDSKVIDVIKKVIEINIEKDWNEIALKEKNNSLEDLVRVLWTPGLEQGFEYTKNDFENGIQFSCTKCPFYDLAKEIDGEKWFYYLICYGDPYITRGFNPKIKFERTKTLMEGHDYCNHKYLYII